MSLAKKRAEALAKELQDSGKTKLGWMIGLLIVVLCIFGVASFLATDEDAEKDAPEKPDLEGVENEDGTVVEMDDEGNLAAKVDVEIDDAEFGLGKETPIDAERLAPVRDDSDGARTVFEQEPLAYLVDLVTNDASIRRKHRGFDALETETLVSAPGRYRGRAVEFKGKLLAGQDVPWKDVVQGVSSLHRGYIELLVPGPDGEVPGGLVSFTSVGKPLIDDRQSEPAKPGSIVRVQGFFLKVWRARAPGGEEIVSTPHIVVRRFLEAYRIVKQTKVDAFWFKVRDGSNLDEPPFWLCLNYLQNLTPETYRRQRDEEGLYEVRPIPKPGQPFPTDEVPENVITDFGSRGKLLDSRPTRFRGRLVRLSGVLHRVDPVAPYGNPGGIKRYYDCILAQESRFIVPVVVPFPPDRYGAMEGMNVEVEGYFYKRRIWETKAGDRRLAAPLIMVTDIIPQVPAGEGAYAYIQWILGGAALLFVVVLVGMLYMDRRSSKSSPRRRSGARITEAEATGESASATPEETADGDRSE